MAYILLVCVPELMQFGLVSGLRLRGLTGNQREPKSSEKRVAVPDPRDHIPVSRRRLPARDTITGTIAAAARLGTWNLFG
jgi:hypothetical protein